MPLKTKTLFLLAALTFASACSSINIEAPTGVDRKERDGAGAQ